MGTLRLAFIFLGVAACLGLGAGAVEAQDGRALEPLLRPGLRHARFHQLFPASDAGGETLHSRYPFVLAHGIMGFEKATWGPITIRYFKDLEAFLRSLGLEVYTSEVPMSGSIASRAEAMAAFIRELPCEKVNIISHSMGGLDSRFMIARLGMGSKVASVSMVAGPHHGTLVADWAVQYLSRRHPAVERLVKRIGLDTQGFHDLSVEHMEGTFNPSTPDDPRVVYLSYGGSQSLHKMFPLLVPTSLIIRRLEQMALALREGEPVPSLSETETRLLDQFALTNTLTEESMSDVLRRLPLDWIQPDLAGQNDGMVSLSSTRRGQHVGDIDADHLDQLGWLTRWEAHRFYAQVARRVVALGF